MEPIAGLHRVAWSCLLRRHPNRRVLFAGKADYAADFIFGPTAGLEMESQGDGLRSHDSDPYAVVFWFSVDCDLGDAVR